MRLRDVWTYVEAAEYLGVTRQRIQQMVRDGRLGSVRSCGRVFVSDWTLCLEYQRRALKAQAKAEAAAAVAAAQAAEKPVKLEVVDCEDR